MEGLMEPLKGWLKVFDPPSLHEAMKKERSMEFSAPTRKFTSKGTFFSHDNNNFTKKEEKAKDKSTLLLEREILNDLTI